MLFLHFGSYLEKYWVNSDKCNVVCPTKLEKFNESDILQVSEIFLVVLGVFYYSCF